MPASRTKIDERPIKIRHCAHCFEEITPIPALMSWHPSIGWKHKKSDDPICSPAFATPMSPVEQFFQDYADSPSITLKVVRKNRLERLAERATLKRNSIRHSIRHSIR